MRVGFVSFTLVTVLAACGGGGGGAQKSPGETPQVPTPPPVSNPPGMLFDPPIWNETVYQGDSAVMNVKIALNPPIQERVNVRIVDSEGIVDRVNVESKDSATATAQVLVSPKLAARTYEGSLIVSLCKDDPAQCLEPYSQSSWRYPYRFVVRPLPNLTPLTSLPQVSDWTTVQGNAGHNAYIAARVDPSQFNMRFRFSSSDAYTIGPMATKGSMAYFSTRANGTSEALHAFDESTGQPVWKLPLGYGNVPLTMGSDVLYLPNFLNGIYGLWAINLATGAARNFARLDFNEGVFENGFIYLNSRSRTQPNDNKLQKLNGENFVLQWNDGVRRSQLARIPALDFNYVYQYEPVSTGAAEGDAALVMMDKFSGELKSVVRMPRLGDGESGSSVPVICGTDSVIVLDGAGSQRRVRVIDPVQAKLRYDLVGTGFPVDPVCNQGFFYVVGDSGLEARNLSDGSLVWSWNPPKNDPLYSQDRGYLGSNLVLFDNIIFVSLSNSTYAIDLSSHQTVWHHNSPEKSIGSGGGGRKLAVSRNGVLYVSGSGSSVELYAFNLK